ncbi:hypothetical protein [Aquisalinus flavus]|uniref:Uncharacterized protein n=1 Tax=Aquisalinus flavus TaxID=1526572 RepID=A0A8J2V243_9PROT|nr:hypothetical protein [Aquisalinus flavus]MBD0425519.1 hypothetical protein [Aquisalinus flavus]UNE48850.1 hypothetical protein FF099_12720 [Aquisalinus flavus]GGD15403.1 hypothetical protein GCM10011342_25240 [Aquisalinus flavus]
MYEPRDIIARTRRFAHLIASSAEEADRVVFDVVEAEQSYLSARFIDDSLRTRLYRSLCDRLAAQTSAATEEGEADGSAQPVIWRFRRLPMDNRLAFALMVIEEIPSSTAADILRIPDTTLEKRIQQSRRMMFEE